MSKILDLGQKKRSKSALKNLRQEQPAKNSQVDYSSFDQLDGGHPWMQKVPEGFISYPARRLNGGKVSYFNFDLAKEMGLISPNHSGRMNKKLENKLLETFCIRIINEYDQEHNVIYPKSMLKKNRYMATRYLQLQHPDKTGRTSGDGRCVWNGVVEFEGNVWDVSSRGTGVTCLAPGAVEAGKPLKSGNNEFGYGCGLAEIDELYAAAIMAEIFHKNGLNTERVLAIIDLGKGIGIGVRAAKNLIRPAHLFMYLKQNNLSALKRATDYLIERQHQNGEWKFGANHKRKYEFLLEEVCESFAQFTAQLDRDYIFAWLDWDGDNVLANAGIIDYGSVRQFGLRHDQYRYDDVERYSTSLNEQRLKARLMIQVFAQMVDFLETGERKALARFRHHGILKKFDQHFRYYLLDHFLFQLGFHRKQRESLLHKQHKLVESLFANFSYFERVKTYKKLGRVADGINRPAIFNMRAIARELPHFFAQADDLAKAVVPAKTFFKVILADTAGRKDKKITYRLKQRILRFQTQYRSLLIKAIQLENAEKDKFFVSLKQRSDVINKEDRITGNALLNIVSEILKVKKNGLPDSEIQKVIDQFILSQCLLPETLETTDSPRLHGSRRTKRLMEVVLTLVEGYKEDI